MNADIDVFAWGDDSRVAWLGDMFECVDNGRYYEPPVNLHDLAATLRIGLHHASALQAKLNILNTTFVPTRLLARSDFTKLAYNFLVLGNGYLEAERNRFGGVLGYRNRLGLHMRKASHDDGYYYMRKLVLTDDDYIPGSDVCHILQPDLSQEIYGVPYYLAGLNSAELNNSATTFRRRYYDNGSHAAQREGNFKNVFLRSPNGNPDGIKLMPISEVAAKDEFLNIKNVSAQDMLSIHRVPPSLMGIVPTAAGGLGDARTAAEVFAANEITPLQMMFIEVNERLGEEVFKFKPYELSAPA